MRQEAEDVLYKVLARPPQPHSKAAEDDDSIIRGYFNLGPDGSIPGSAATGTSGTPSSLSSLSDYWASRDERYAAVRPYIPGARMLRQDPVECLFSFICSSNNHISRIHGMVEKLCSRYGTALRIAIEPSEEIIPPKEATPAGKASPSEVVTPPAVTPGGGPEQFPAAAGMSFFAFPTLDQLAEATEADLRAAGFG